MSPIAEILLAIALSLPTPWYKAGKAPETDVAYRERLQTIAQAIALEAEANEDWQWDSTSLAAATFVTWYSESKFALEVHNGSGKSRHGEDDGKARCLGQLHKTGWVPKSVWKTLTGTDLEATRRCARATMKVLAMQGKRCGMKKKANLWAVARMEAAYAHGMSCAPTKNSTARARRWSKLMDRIETMAIEREAALAAAEKPTPALMPAEN
ncbi:MAG: hypothetical protein RL033_4896 [Pseudomonadota bacterium]|jgi:hypothetical protein